MTTGALSAAIAGGRAGEALKLLARDGSAVVRDGDLALLRSLADLVGDPLPAGVAWRLGYVLHTLGRLGEALSVFARADDEGDLADLASLNAARASTHWARGDPVLSRQCADLALLQAQESGEDTALAAAWVAQALVSGMEGDRNANRRAYQQALPAAERAGDVLTQVRICNNLGSIENDFGQPEAALAHLDRAAVLAEEVGFEAIRLLTLTNRADALLGLGRVEEALVELSQAKELALAQDSPNLAYAALGLGEANRMIGNASRAAAAYREAIGAAMCNASTQALLPAMAGLARTTVEDDPAEAREAAKRALELPAANGQVPALLANGWLTLREGDVEAAAELARRAGLEAGRRDDPRGLAECLELQALCGSPQAIDLAAEAGTLWAASGNPIGGAVNAVLRARLAGDPGAEQAARAQLRSLGVRDSATRVAGPLMALGRSTAIDLRVRALGAFAVLVDDQPVPASAWQSRKPREAFKILVGRRGQPLIRDALAEHLWPGELDTSRRLSVALSTIRGVLDPERRHASDYYLAADRQSVWLVVDHLDLDVIRFWSWAQAGLRAARAGRQDAIGTLEQAAAAYTGHFLEEDAYADWATDVREELLGAALDVRRELSSLLVRDGRPDRALPWLVSLLADDPYDEPSHRELIRILHRSRRHGEVRRRYRVYAQRMTEIEAGAAPLAEVLTGP